MQITKGHLIQMGAMFYEQALMEALPQLSASKGIIDKYLTAVIRGERSFVEMFESHPLLHEWLKELGKVSRQATVYFQDWLRYEVVAEFLHDYRFIDEKGRVYKRESLAAENRNDSFSIIVYHFPSVEWKEGLNGGPKYRDYEAVFMPRYGWAYNEQQIFDFEKAELIEYGPYPSSGVFKKNFLNNLKEDSIA